MLDGGGLCLTLCGTSGSATERAGRRTFLGAPVRRERRAGGGPRRAAGAAGAPARRLPRAADGTRARVWRSVPVDRDLIERTPTCIAAGERRGRPAEASPRSLFFLSQKFGGPVWGLASEAWGGGASLVPPRLDAHANADADVLYEPPFVSARPAAGLHAREGRVQAAY